MTKRSIGSVELTGTALSDGSDAGAVAAEITNLDFPSEEYVQIDGAAQTVTTSDIYLSGDVSRFNYHAIEAITAAAVVEVSLDGTNFVATDVTLLSTLAGAASTPAGDIGYIEGKYFAIRVRPAAATSTNARVAHSVK